LKKLLLKHESQSLIFPNVDPGSIFSIMFLARQYQNCNFFLRLIGWTEFWTPGHPFLIKFAIRRIGLNKNVFLAAETDSLRDFFNLDQVVPYPLDVRKASKKEGYYLFVAGSARKEKGFKVLPTLANLLNNLSLPYVVVAQQTNPHNENLLLIQNQLIECENVLLLPAYLSREELVDWIDKSRAVLMPYESSAYELRGSAVLYEAAERATPVIAFKGGGYEKDIMDFHLGEIALNEFDLPSALLRLQNNSLKQDLFVEYANYTQMCLRSWLRI
jgi:glycosyltransferase involved in cell wall biosynthesis